MEPVTRGFDANSLLETSNPCLLLVCASDGRVLCKSRTAQPRRQLFYVQHLRNTTYSILWFPTKLLYDGLASSSCTGKLYCLNTTDPLDPLDDWTGPGSGPFI